MATESHAKLHMSKFQPSSTLKSAALGFVAIGLIGLALGLLKNPERMWTSYLVAFFFVSLLGLGGLFFTAINHIARAGWSAGIRRLAEGMGSFIPVILVGSLILLAGVKKLYPWANPEVVAGNALIAAKAAYLNMGFLVVRLLVFGLGSAYFMMKIVGNSLKQDVSGDEALTGKNLKLSIAYVLFFAIFFSLFSVDLLMSLLPTWYSTIFGVYCFAGMFQSSLAFFVLLLLYMKKTGNISGYYSEEHIHDVAKYLKAFTVFWAYIAFSQYMLIWYANIPEETEYYLLRAQGGWLWISMSLLIFKFAVPFLALLPRSAKRNPTHLAMVCCLILVMQYVDIYWMVYPNFNDNHVVFGFYEIALLLLFMGLFLLNLIRFFTKNNIVAIKDPRMHESLGHHVTY